MNIEHLIVGNGAGAIKTLSDVERACKSAATRIMVGAGTLERRTGNIPATAEGTFYVHPIELWAMNSLGLPNMGMTAWEDELFFMAELAHRHGKKLGFNAAGFTPQEYAELTRRAFARGVDVVQLNLSCANVWGPQGNKAIAAENPELVERILHEVGNVLPNDLGEREIEVKVAPNHDMRLISELSSVIAASGIVKRVVTANAKGGQRRKRQDGQDALAFRSSAEDSDIKHEGALSGSALTAETPKLVSLYRERLPGSVGIIALGGIFNGAHAHECIERGAEGLEVTTAFFIYGPGIFTTLYEGLADRMPSAA